MRAAIERVSVPNPRDGDLGVPELVHDLRQEVGAIRHLVDLMENQFSADPAGAGLLAALQAEVAALDELLQAEAAPDRPLVTDLEGVARSVTSTTRVTYDGTIELHASTVPPVAGPSSRLRRVLLNLVVNACEAAPGGRVVIRVAAADDAVTVDVEDDGTEGSSPPRDSAGLGLRIVFSVVRDCGGSVDISTSSLGGRRVALRFPVAKGGAR